MANVFRGSSSRSFLTSNFTLGLVLGEKVSTLDKICGMDKKLLNKNILFAIILDALMIDCIITLLIYICNL